MGIGMIVILVAVVLLVVYLVRSMTNQQTQTHPAGYYAAPTAQQTAEQRAVESARDIVQRRYAAGEIDREEYLQKLKDLWAAPRAARCKKSPPGVLRVVKAPLSNRGGTMKALKTIVATAVIVFALTTVAMAGARHVGGWGDSSSPAAGPAATQTHHSAGVTLTDDQFARLLHAMNGQAAKPHTPQADHQKAGDSASHAQAHHGTQSQDSSGATHHVGATHVGSTTHHSGGTHHGGVTHDAGTQHDE